MVLGQIKRWAKGIAPKGAIRAYHRYRRAAEHSRNSNRTPQEVFSEIYRKGVWGTGKAEPFYSGTGSSTESIVGPYVAAISEYLRSLPEESRRVVDLGCGDFSVGRQLLPYCSSYIGVDVVPALIEHLNSQVSHPQAHFVHADIIDGQLPDGDICLIRQVFQHLSNAQIGKVLAKLDRYRTVFIT
ncbi:MAG TPA: class I SAM-dependent methyltransferase, partial [Polyangiaceae bacterium]